MKYPKIRYPSDTDGLYEEGYIHVVEKLDGGNFRFMYDGEQLHFGTRNNMYSDIENVPKMFKPVVDYIFKTINMEELKTFYEGYWFYGEAMVPHTISYDRDETPLFIGFDVYHPERERFLTLIGMEWAFTQLGFETAPVVMSFTHDDWPDNIETPVSEYRTPRPEAEKEIDRKGLAEGVVIRNDNSGARTKIVRDDFKEKNKATFGGDYQPSEAEKFVAEYVTEARIKKHAYKLRDEGHYDNIKMQMMERLPKRVLSDVFEEHGWEILCSNYDLDTDTRGNIRSEASSKCATVLKMMCNEL